MVLPSSGQITFDQIRIELGVPSQSPFSLADAANGVYAAINTSSPSFPNAAGPHSVTEWYGYDHTASTCTALNSSTSLRYSIVTPANPDICNTGGNDYSSTQVFYSTDCTDLGSGCTVYGDSSCTATAYAGGARYITVDATNLYYGLSAASVVNVNGACSD